MTEVINAGVVVIGRNEGERLKRCLASILTQYQGPIVYVDSGSSDGSVEHAQSIGIEVVELDMTQPFTMARGRNAGLNYLIEHNPECEFVQFVDGDCEVAVGWIDQGLRFLNANDLYALVCGNVSERHPEATIYNYLMDMEWQGPPGDVESCGGIALYRIGVFENVGLFNEGMIAGEEGDLCLRLRQDGSKLMKLDIPMVNHDADMQRFVQWWCRSVRCGHAYAHSFDLHGKSPEQHEERYKKRQVLSCMAYGFCFPLLLLLLVSVLLTQSLSQLLVIFIFTAILFVLSLYIRLIEKCVKSRLVRGNSQSQAWLYGAFVVLGKFPEAQGVGKYYFDKIRGVTAKIIEYRDY